MKKFFPLILIFLIVVNFFAPFSVIINDKNKAEFNQNKIYAALDADDPSSYKFEITGVTNAKSSKDRIYWSLVTSVWPASDNSGLSEKTDMTLRGTITNADGSDVTDTDGNTIEPVDYAITKLSKAQINAFYFNKLTPETTYIVSIEIIKNNEVFKSLVDKYVVKTQASGSSLVESEDVAEELQTTKVKEEELDLGDGFMGLVARFFYWVFFAPTSYVFALSGKIFDYAFAYSVDDASYRSEFVIQGWKVVRDFCNIFFIFILLYSAFTTILDMKGPKAKEIIVNIIIIGLLINFSLFITRVLVDFSNITARVFYNTSAIQITDGQGVTTTKIIPLSSGLVGKIKPQKLLMSADEINDIKNENESIKKTKLDSKIMTTGKIILVLILATCVNVVGLIMFLTVAFVFVGRVLNIWLAMVFAPAAFFTYIIPKMRDKIDQVSWNKWWSNLIDAVLVAPIFIFLLYLILKFLETDILFVKTDGKTGIDLVVSIFVPFIFIMLLLNTAKKQAVKLSGDIGKALGGIGSQIAGVALGVLTGGGAMLARGTIGKAASRMANSEKVKERANKGGVRGFIGKQQLKAGESLGKSSFDARNTKIAQKAGKGLGVDLNSKVMGLGVTAKTGGYDAWTAEKVKKQMADAKRMEMSESAASRQDEKAKKWKKDKEVSLAEYLKQEKARAGHAFDEAAVTKKFESDFKSGIVKKYKEKRNSSGEVEKDSSGNVVYEQTNDFFKPEDKPMTSKEVNEERYRKQKERLEENFWFRPYLSDYDRQVKADTLTQLGKKAGTKEEGTSPIEKFHLSAKKEKAEEILADSENELKGINHVLENIANKLGTGKTGSQLEKTDIAKYTDSIQKEIENLKLEGEQLKNKYKADPSNIQSKTDFLDNQEKLRKKQQEQREANNILNTKRGLEEISQKQRDNIDALNEKIKGK